MPVAIFVTSLVVSPSPAEDIRNLAHDDAPGHHAERVEGGNEVGGGGVEVKAEEVREPEEEYVVCELEKAEGEGVPSDIGDLQGLDEGDGLGLRRAELLAAETP